MRSLFSFSLAAGLGIMAACAGSDGDVGAPDAGASSSGSMSSTSSSSSSSGESSTSSSGASSSGASSGSQGDGGPCNDLMQLGSPFDILTTQTPAPTPQGGSIGDGTWVATAGKLWGSNAAEGSKFGTAGASTWKTTGNAIETVATGATSMKVVRRAGVFATNSVDNSVSFSLMCSYPAGDAGPGDLQNAKYTVETGTLHLYVSLFGSTTVLEYTYALQ